MVLALGLAALDKIRCISITDEERLQFLVAEPGEDARAADLIAIQLQNRVYRSRVGRLVGAS